MIINPTDPLADYRKQMQSKSISRSVGRESARRSRQILNGQIQVGHVPRLVVRRAMGYRSNQVVSPY